MKKKGNPLLILLLVLGALLVVYVLSLIHI